MFFICCDYSLLGVGYSGGFAVCLVCVWVWCLTDLLGLRFRLVLCGSF